MEIIPKVFYFIFKNKSMITLNALLNSLSIKMNLPFVDTFAERFVVQCPSLKRITLSQHRSDNNNRMIKVTDVFLCTTKVKNCQ